MREIPWVSRALSRRILSLHSAGFDFKINRPRALSARDTDSDTVVDEARECRDVIGSYDEPRDCLPDLSDVAPTFRLAGAGKPDSASTNSRDMAQRGFVYRVVIRATGRSQPVSTPNPPLPRAHTRAMYIMWNKQKVKHHRRMDRRESRARKSATLMATRIPIRGKDIALLFPQDIGNSSMPAKARLTGHSTTFRQSSLYRLTSAFNRRKLFPEISES